VAPFDVGVCPSSVQREDERLYGMSRLVHFSAPLEVSYSSCLLGHGDRAGGVAWHPQATLSQSVDSVNLARVMWSLNRFVHAACKSQDYNSL
jgi:hypothetical protein